MIESAQELHPDEGSRFSADAGQLRPADYSVASGLFNVKQDASLECWQRYVVSLLCRLDELSVRGFAFNVLTSYSDKEKMRPDLYYADPRQLFDFCQRQFSRWVTVLHDYGWFEFTMIVRKDIA